MTWPCKSQPGGCHCRCHAIVTGMATTKRRQARSWLPKHDEELLRRLDAGETLEQIAGALTERFKVRRTPDAIRQHLRTIDRSARDGWISQTDLFRLLGVSRYRLRAWGEAGVLPPSTTHGEHGRWQRYRRTDVEAFVTAHAGRLFDPKRVKDARLRSLAEVAATVNRRRSQEVA